MDEEQEAQRDKNDSQLRLRSTVKEVKLEFRGIGSKSKELVLKLGNELEKHFRADDVCEEIKSILNDEIVEGLISRRNIERYCLDKWKKKTKPKKGKENDNLSFPQEKKQQAMVTTNGNLILENQDSSRVDGRETGLLDGGYEEVELDDEELIDIDNSDMSKSTLNGNDYLEFEFSLPFDKLRQYMLREFSNHQGTEPVWIHGRLDKFTGKIINTDLGRIFNKD